MTDETTPIFVEEERHKRQKLIWGDEGQDRLANARVSVIGLGPQGVYAALAMTALGIGNINLLDATPKNPGEQFLDMNVPSGPRGKTYPSLINRINPGVNIQGYDANLASSIESVLLAGSDVIIETTNDPHSKERAIDYGHKHNIPVITTSAKWGYTRLSVAADKHDKGHLMPMFAGHEQDELMGLLMAGVITEEARKFIFKEEGTLTQPVRFKLGEGYRFGFPEQNEEPPQPDKSKYEGLQVAFLGGGALGCWGAIAGAKMGLGRLDIFDYDLFESHNINRQVLGYDGINKLKSEHIAKKISSMSKGRTASEGFNKLILPGFQTDRQYDVVFDFVDNPYTRALNSIYAISADTPMISAGALPYSARWDVHQKDKTECLDCLFDIYNAGRQAEMIRRASCAANPDPSVVMSNAIAAVAAVAELYTIIEPEKFGEPFNGEQTYRATSQKRFGTSPRQDTCDCYHQPVPDMTISQEDVDAFIKANPHLLQE